MHLYLLLLGQMATDVTPPEVPGDAESLSTIQVTASRSAQSTNDTASAVSVVTRDEILSRPNTLLPDLLAGETGVFVQQTTPGQAIPIIRGLKGSQNVHLVDGMRLNTAFFRNAPNQYLALVDPFLVEQIEVVRGPASTLYGGDAMGGVVNILSHRPSFTSDTVDFSGQLHLSYDSADDKTISHVDLDAGNATLATSLGVSYQDVGVRSIGGGDEIPFTAYSARSANNKWVYTPNDEDSWLFDIQYLHQPSTPRVDNLVTGFGQTEPDSEVFLFKPNERLFTHLSHETTGATSWYDAANYHLAWQKITDDRESRGFGSSTTRFEQNSSDLFTVQANFEKKFASLNQLIYGLDYNDDTIESARQERDADGVLSTVGSRFPNESSLRSVGLYGDYHMFFNEQEITVGARYSDYRIDLNSPDLDEDVLNLDDLTWHVSWIRFLNNNHRVFANIGRGFRPPNIFDLGQVGERPGNRFNVINPNLDPEVVHSVDFGWKHAGNGWQAEVVAYYSDYSDQIASVETGELTDDGRVIVQSANLSDVNIYGLESEFNWIVGEGGVLSGNVNWVWGEEVLDDEREPADRIPPLYGVLSYKQPVSERWEAKGQVRFAASQHRLSSRDARDARINPNGTGGFAVYDLYANWNITEQFRLRLGLENLFDKKYRIHASGLEAAGRNVHASFNYWF